MTSLSTEGRIFARQLSREAMRREAIGARALSLGKEGTWIEATINVATRIADAKGPVKQAKEMKSAIARLEAIDVDDRSFIFAPGTYTGGGKRKAMLSLYTLQHSPHPMAEVTGETGILVRRHMFSSNRVMIFYRIMDELAFISDHTVGRMLERGMDGAWSDPMQVFGLAGMLGMAGEIGGHMAEYHREKPPTQLNVLLEDALLTGSMRHLLKQDASELKYFQPFFDVRTMLDGDGGNADQRRQAGLVSTLLTYLIKEGIPVLGMSPEEIELVHQIPYLNRREDYITAVLNKSPLQG